MTLFFVFLDNIFRCLFLKLLKLIANLFGKMDYKIQDSNIHICNLISNTETQLQ